MKVNRLLNVVCLLVLFFSHSLLAQEVQTGSIEHLDQDNGFITISGQRYGYSDQLTQVFIEDKQVGAQKMDVDMVVRFTLDNRGTLLHVEIIGPDEKLQFLKQN
ncbi:MAG: hypothetical protein ACSHXZ_11625 [Gammaproteobacteria bacterium]